MSIRKYERTIAKHNLKKQGYPNVNKKAKLNKAEKGNSFFALNWRTFRKDGGND